MKNAPVRHALEYGAYSALRGLLRALPHAASRALGADLGGLAFHLDRRRRAIADENLAAAFPRLDDRERRAIVRSCFRHFGASFADALSALRFDPVELCQRVTLEGWHHFEEGERAGHGLLVMGAHLGNWEIVPPAIATWRGPMAAVGRAADNPHFNREIQRLRTRFGNRSLDKRGSVREMYRVLQEGGRLGLLIDQRVRANEAIDVPFFGRPALTSPILARLSLKTGAPVVAAFGWHLPGGRYRIEARPPIFPEGRGEEAVLTLTRRYLAVVEDAVAPAPEQWLWLHRRWKH